ncbi:MAG: 50S ribosomal protein L29 [Candidatus Nealsonbacteria bacterium CG08_land_8_20_14_0_20_43_11]|uniref:Large ribosomal subunit protein uL29 n=1 Tax=Candidatus Nealsonbacteria bacterium CG08_land_8_20_14_0_20_43_11 TaxID=1974706 RepID=A0A2M6T0N4_9BACT|nr:MAG: 50S ribosomal protein L29 [Candidatus Nealsonbacteria bacterium CG08_land_8_20_14_0_20_43_11]
MKLKELRQRPIVELEQLLKENREKLRQSRFDLTAGKLKNVKIIANTRKEIARILTLIKETALKNEIK